MAIYHLTAKTGTRASGQSAGAKFAYIQREEKYAGSAKEVLHRSSGHMPSWAMSNPSRYWIAADRHERANGRLFKEIEFALPVELDARARIDLAERFAARLTTGERLPFSLAVHAGKGTNPHCHLMISERVNDGIPRDSAAWFRRFNGKSPATGGARKTDALKPKDWLEQVRADWAKEANHALKRAGRSVRIDHRSFQSRGIARQPTKHLGPAVIEMEQKGIRTNRATAALNREKDIHERNRQDQIRQIEGRVGRGRGAGGVAVGFDSRGDSSEDKSPLGRLRSLWGRFRPYRGPEGPGTQQGAQRAVYWAVSRLSGDGGGWGNSTTGLRALAGRFQQMAWERRASEDRARRAEMERARKAVGRDHTGATRDRGADSMAVKHAPPDGMDFGI